MMDWSTALENKTEKRKGINPTNRKKIFTKPLANSIVIADISFSIKIKNGVQYNSRGEVFTILEYRNNDNVDFELHIKLDTGKEFYMSLVPITQNWGPLMKNLFKAQCVWVIRNILNNVLTVDVVIRSEKLPISRADYIAEIFFKRDYSEFETLASDKVCYPDEFYKQLKGFQDNVLDYEKREVQDDKLVPTLRPYQYRAVQWMLSRECNEFQIQNSSWMDDVIHKSTSVSGTTLYYYVYAKVLSSDLVEFPKYFRGGILGDEMGLGKTVVVIALILNNPRNIELELDNNDFLMAEAQNIEENCEPAAKKIKVDKNSVRCLCGDNKRKSKFVKCPECLYLQHEYCVGYEKGFVYFCPSCWVKQKLIKSKATLVVAPASIYRQWFQEIEKHVDEEAWTKGVFMYDGVKKNNIQPSVLSTFDVVITTYTTLATEFGYTSESKHNFRHQRKYIRECSPITQIQWWRVCLDEAQMVEFGHNSLIISQMAKLIPAVNHWSVTGTPIQHSVHDLFYLTDWFNVAPFNDRSFWEHCLYSPFVNGKETPLLSVVSQIFWRNSKEDVAGELTIPKQKTVYHPVTFTPVEQSFYMMEHADVLVKFTDEIARLGLDLNQRLDSLSKGKLTKVLAPMLNLRQACSHHLAVCYENISEMYKEKKSDNKRKKCYINKTMTLTALLNYLQMKTRSECEEALKSYLTSLSDLAALYCYEKNWGSAIECYQKIYSTSTEFENKLKMDYFKIKIQTLMTYSSDLEQSPDEIRSKSPEELETLAGELKKCFKSPYNNGSFVADAQGKLSAENRKSMSEFRKKLGTLNYLKSLNKENRDPCPVCISDLDSEWGLLQCGHSYCLHCVKSLLQQNDGKFVNCAICREKTFRSDIGVVDIHTDNENFDVEILGDHSSKIDTILTTLLDLKRKDPNVKVLVFSKWDIVLSVLGNAFKQNNIQFKRLPSKNLKILDDFKDPEKKVTALLLPYTWGCKGLNLIEATHVFLVEPTLNPAEELQAVGRVHRMGQTKETIVHRFLVKGTIEEGIHSAVSEAKDKWDREMATLEDLKNLFVIK